MQSFKILLPIAVLFFIMKKSVAQGIIDTSILFSQSDHNGSARVLGIGGTQISLGGDVSSIVSNPAGLGMFNRSTISVSTGINFITSQSNYFGTTTPDQKANLNIPNISLVLHKELKSKYTNFRSGAFGLSYNRINDFHQQVTYQGRSETSMLDFFLDNAQGVFIQDFEDIGTFDYSTIEGLAARTALIFPTSDIDTDGFDDEYVSDILGSPLQTEVIEVKGAQSQFSFSYGANYDDILFIGAGIGLTSINYNSSKIYEEGDFIYDKSANPNYINPLNKYSLQENLNITANGINASLGVMFRPLDFIQFGGAITTPTYYSIDDAYDANLSVNYVSTKNEQAETEIVESNYSLTTPLRLSAGTTVFIGKSGFISADIEMLNYGESSLNSNDFIILNDNQYISANYGKSYNLKVGGEYRHDIFRLRAGYAYYEDPAINSSDHRDVLSLGFGVRMKKYFLDVALVNTRLSNSYSPYQLEGVQPVVQINTNSTKGVVTFGVNF